MKLWLGPILRKLFNHLREKPILVCSQALSSIDYRRYGLVVCKSLSFPLLPRIDSDEGAYWSDARDKVADISGIKTGINWYLPISHCIFPLRFLIFQEMLTLAVKCSHERSPYVGLPLYLDKLCSPLFGKERLKFSQVIIQNRYILSLSRLAFEYIL